VNTYWLRPIKAGERYENTLGQPREADRTGLLVRAAMIVTCEEMIQALVDLGYRPPKKRRPGEAAPVVECSGNSG
jgi:hypothetical protein